MSFKNLLKSSLLKERISPFEKNLPAMGTLWHMTGAPLPVVGPRGGLTHSNRTGTVHTMPLAARPHAPCAAFPMPLRAALPVKSVFQPELPPRRGRHRGLRGAPATATLSLLAIRRRHAAERAPSADAGPLCKPSSFIFCNSRFQPGLSAAPGAPPRCPGRCALRIPSLPGNPSSSRR